ncbi:MAG: DUF4159 domain-containing protein [Acidobacteria bacterium]|nr:DUF4159 domain-containing protein [Acidobacteriota bacterium]
MKAFKSRVFTRGTPLISVALVCFFFSADGAFVARDDDREASRGSEFLFARVQFNSYFFGGGWTPGWAHDYPRAERNFLKILAEVTSVKTTPESYVIVRLEDPGIMNFPLLYFSEPGTWDITPEEARNFREYLKRGGFAIFDDFDGPAHWSNFVRCIKEVLPERNVEELKLEHPVFHSFFEIETLEMPAPYAVWGKPTFLGLSDEKGRLLAVVNFNNDIGDYWEWSDESLFPIGLSNEAYKFGVNYVIYALTH